ncbi:MAG: hypothetical protein L0332_25125 [Chloroflexi bacterium]|nr:hypothetical protein [Chloroflexota bacterium]MCI0575173.1 hypothetical protein [Chloroflexota bacterium]MCI0647145.1 hypothetical protein [Chloroflexota bacterium]MCI0729979.1 hypothetical protein [Chloroflexota bacterium]
MNYKMTPQQSRPPVAGPMPVSEPILPVSGRVTVGLLLVVALIAFELFNFDTTRFALLNLLGDVRFLRVSWAAILAVAFCAIDFAGLVRLFMPDQGEGSPREVWYLMGAWLLGATMNALMTWWAVSVALLTHELGNEVLSREQLVEIVPVFIAVLVWLTRILFIGAFTITGGYLFAPVGRPAAQYRSQPAATLPRPAVPRPPAFTPVTDELPIFLQEREPAGQPAGVVELEPSPPPRSPIPGRSRPAPVGMQAKSRASSTNK